MFKEKFIILKIQVLDGMEINLYWVGDKGILPWTSQRLEAIEKGYFHSYIECVNHINNNFVPAKGVSDPYQIEKVFVYEPVL